MSQAADRIEAHRPTATGACQRGQPDPGSLPALDHDAHAGEVERAVRDRGLAPVTVDRLVRCYELCVRLWRDGREFVSSREISEFLGCGPSQIRKEFSMLGKLGTRGYGYRLPGLLYAFEGFLGAREPASAVIVGVEGLGAALLNNGGFARDGLHFVAMFDFDPSRNGTTCDGLTVKHVSMMPEVLDALAVDVGVLAVSDRKAQEAADLLVKNGVRAILNLTPAILSPKEGVAVINIDLGIELKKLAFYAAGSRRRPSVEGAASHDRWRDARADVRPVRRDGGDSTQSRGAASPDRGVMAAVGGNGS